MSQAIENILRNYDSDNPGVKANLARMLYHGRVGHTGKLLIYPVDQGFEHGPDRCFAVNPQAYDPLYHFRFAVAAGFSAFAAPLGMLEAGAGTFAGRIPLILKLNHGNSLVKDGGAPDQAVVADIRDALRLGCNAVGFTIYPGSAQSPEMFEEIAALAQEAKSYGLPVIIWSYPRGSFSKDGETAIDVVAYGAHLAALLGAHIIKIKMPTDHVETKEGKEHFRKHHIPVASKADRVRHIVQCCFGGRRIVVFSGGEAKDIDDVYDDARAVMAGGGNGSIIARNLFKRPWNEAMTIADTLGNIYTE